jgi:hypothetical protein
MDRQIVWPGAIPLETDILNTNRNTMVALGRLTQDVLGSSTLVSGLACVPTSVASMAVNIGPGAIYGLQNIDNTAYSSLAADTTDQTVKQGVLLASAGTQLTMTAPTASGNSVIYLIEAAYSEVDTGAVTLPFYNSANPAVPFSGPANNGQPSFTKRAGTVNVQAKAGVAGASPSAPAVDAGFVPLYYVTIAYGQTSITAANIVVAPGAPFLSAGLAGLMPIAGGTFTGSVAGITPATSDNSTKLATTAMVQAATKPGALLAANGYEKRPSGIIEQWGVVTGSFPQALYGPYSFPIAFPNGFLNIAITTISPEHPSGSTGAAGDDFFQIPTTNLPTATEFWVWSDSISGGTDLAAGFYWRAIGY